MDEPVLVYDDDCGFCTWCADWAARHADVTPVGFASLSADRRERLPDDYESCVHLLTEDAVYSCGAAVEATLRRSSPLFEALFRLCSHVDAYPRLRERLYRWGADRRDWWGKIVRMEPGTA